MPLQKYCIPEGLEMIYLRHELLKVNDEKHFLDMIKLKMT